MQSVYTDVGIDCSRIFDFRARQTQIIGQRHTHADKLTDTIELLGYAMASDGMGKLIKQLMDRDLFVPLSRVHTRSNQRRNASQRRRLHAVPYASTRVVKL